MSHAEQGRPEQRVDTAPGDEGEGGVWSYLVGLGLATLLTIVSFFVEPSIPVALAVLAVAQMGIHLVFFIHITSGPDNASNVMALAFGVLIVLLVIVGSLWIMANMNQNMAAMDPVMQMRH
jgi:cytochrome o ubiquinol oxidase operon protein cyoD